MKYDKYIDTAWWINHGTYITMIWWYGGWTRGQPFGFFFCDGQGAGPMAAECCAKTLLPKLLRNMSAIPQAQCIDPVSMAIYGNVIMLSSNFEKHGENIYRKHWEAENLIIRWLRVSGSMKGFTRSNRLGTPDSEVVDDQKVMDAHGDISVIWWVAD